MNSLNETICKIKHSQEDLTAVIRSISGEQERIETQIDSISEKVLQQLHSHGDSSHEPSVNIVESSISILQKLREYDSILTTVIESLTKEILGREDENISSIGIAVNNFYNAVAGIEMKLSQIQTNLNQINIGWF